MIAIDFELLFDGELRMIHNTEAAVSAEIEIEKNVAVYDLRNTFLNIFSSMIQFSFLKHFHFPTPFQLQPQNLFFKNASNRFSIKTITKTVH